MPPLPFPKPHDDLPLIETETDIVMQVTMKVVSRAQRVYSLSNKTLD